MNSKKGGLFPGRRSRNQRLVAQASRPCVSGGQQPDAGCNARARRLCHCGSAEKSARKWQTFGHTHSAGLRHGEDTAPCHFRRCMTKLTSNFWRCRFPMKPGPNPRSKDRGASTWIAE